MNAMNDLARVTGEPDPTFVKPEGPTVTHCQNGTCKAAIEAMYVEPVWFSKRKLSGTGEWTFPESGLCEKCEIQTDMDRQAKAAKERHVLRATRLMDRAGFSKKHQRMEFDNYDVTDGVKTALTKCQEFATGKPMNLFLTGEWGVGKTHLAIAALKARIRAGRPGRFCSVPVLLMEIRERLSTMSEKALIDELLQYEYLILDDAGAEKTTEWTLQTFYVLIDKWDAEERTGMIVTSNLTMPQLTDRLGRSTVSRLTGMCQQVKLTGKDRRVK